MAEITGDLTFTFPDGRPAILRADGTLSLLTIPVASAYLQFKTDGQVNFGGHLDFEQDPIQIHGGIDGWILPPKQFSVDGKVRVCLGDLGCDGGEVVVSSVGLAACVHLLGADVGAGYKWGSSLLWAPSILANIDVMWSGCSVSDYQPAAPPVGSASAAAAGHVMQIGPGLPFAVVSAVGLGAAPHVALLGPGGRRIEAPGAGSLRTPGAVVFHTPKQNTTYFIVRKPAAGRWQIVPLPDSVPVTAVGHGNGLPRPSVHARVAGQPELSRASLRGQAASRPDRHFRRARQGRVRVDRQSARGSRRAPLPSRHRSPGAAHDRRRGRFLWQAAHGPRGRALHLARLAAPGAAQGPHPHAAGVDAPRDVEASHGGPALPPVRAAVRWACAAPASDRPRIAGDDQSGRSAAHGERVAAGRERDRHDRSSQLTPSSARRAAASGEAVRGVREPAE